MSTNCSGASCVYGPCGARIEWSVDAEAVHIFKPISNPGTCGWAVENVTTCSPPQCGDDRGWPLGVDRHHPEPYEGQDLYDEVVLPSCRFRTCEAGGVPGL